MDPGEQDNAAANRNGASPVMRRSSQPAVRPALTPTGSPWGTMFGHRASLMLRPRRVSRVFGSAGISIALHAVVLLLLMVTTWAVGTHQAPIQTAFRAQIVRTPVRDGPIGGFHFSGTAHVDRPDSAGPAEQLDSMQDLAALLADSNDFSVPVTDHPGDGSDTRSGGELRRSDVIGIGTGGGGTGGGRLGRRSLAGGGPVGSLWGVGEGQRGHSIVYVLDRSGSMTDMFPLLKRELRKAVGSLERDQKFNVIWFKASEFTELSSRLLPATIENKRKAFEAIRVIQPEGNTNPTEAIRRGFGYHPDILFLLSDADFYPNNERVFKLIRERNRNHRTTVNTILFVYDETSGGERVEQAVALFRTIAEHGRGVYRLVTEQDARKR